MSEAICKIIRYPEAESTNTVALELGSNGAAHGTIVVADQQTGGRGRLSRYFLSPIGGLYMSAVLRPELSEHDLPLVTLAAGVATAAAIEHISGVSVKLKWPNDLYVQNRKVGGILTEAAPYSHQSKSIPFVVVGIGVNVNTRKESFPESLQNIATSLYCQTDREHNIDSLLQTLQVNLLSEVTLLQKNKEKVLDRWRTRDYMLNRHLSWNDSRGQEIQGVGKGLLPDGRYCLTTRAGDEFLVLAGDITVTDINGKLMR